MDSQTQSQSSDVGPSDYEVQQGDCMSSIAASHGFSWHTLWNLPANASLKETRKDPNVLFPGDRIKIPEPRPKKVDAGTDRSHRFKLVGVPAKLRLRFLDGWEPRAGAHYSLKIDGRVRTGMLHSDGRLVESIPPDAKSIELKLDDEEPIMLNLGTVDPVTEVSGIQGRLSNLGFQPGPIDNIMGPATHSALKQFQKQFGLKVSGEVDNATKSKLLEVHGS